MDDTLHRRIADYLNGRGAPPTVAELQGVSRTMRERIVARVRSARLKQAAAASDFKRIPGGFEANCPGKDEGCTAKIKVIFIGTEARFYHGEELMCSCDTIESEIIPGDGGALPDQKTVDAMKRIAALQGLVATAAELVVRMHLDEGFE